MAHFRSGDHSRASYNTGTATAAPGSSVEPWERDTWSPRPSVLAVALVGLGLVGSALQLEASSLQVTPRAAMGGTALGLEFDLEDPILKVPEDAWLSIDPASGLVSESAISVGFLIDPTSLTIGPEGLAFLRLYEHFGAGGERLVLFLSQEAGGTLALGAWAWDHSDGRLVLAGRGRLPLPARGESEAPTPGKHEKKLEKDSKKSPKGSPAARHSPKKDSDRVVAVEVEWAAATSGEPGYLRAFARAAKRHSRYEHSEGRRSGRKWSLLFERSDSDNQAQSLSYMRLGVLAAEHFAGTFGTLLIDELAVLR